MTITPRYVLPILFALVLPLFAQQIKIEVQGGPSGQLKPIVPRQKTEEQIITERARAAETRGDYDRALSMWREVLNRSPWNPEAIQAVPRNLIILKRYDEADGFLNDCLQKSELTGDVKPISDPSSTYSLTLLRGQVALAREDETKAWEIWNGALNQYSNSDQAVNLLVLMLQQNRRWEDSERLIRDHRKAAKEPAFMALELAMSLRGQMNYTAAADELLLYAESMPSGWQFAQNYLNQFPDDSAVVEKVSGVLKKAVQKDRKNGILWRLYAGYLLKAADLEEALSATIAADSLTDGGGTLVLATSQTLLDEGAVELARRGFQKVLAWKPPIDVSARAELGLGRCFEAAGQWAEAKQAYTSFMDKNPKLKEVDEAQFRIGEILLQHEHNPADALTIFRGLWQKGGTVPRAQVGMRIGDAHAWMGEYENAISAWSNVVKLGGGTVNEDGATALLRMARANIWRDSVSQAYTALDSIQDAATSNTAFNDAVLYSALLDEQGVYRAVRAFAEGDYASFRRDDSVAAVRFDESANLLKSGKLAEWARFSEALALRSDGRPQVAIAVLDTFIQNYPESVDLDRAKYTQAVIRMEDLKDNSGALTELQQFLIDHPRSIYLEQARRRARILTNKVS
jgi:tetratricopeptide (TPR) repeat protein